MPFDSRPRAGALRHRAFRRWMGAGLVSVSGTWMQQVAQSWLVLERTGSGTAVGTVIALQALPSLLLGLWGGTLADRFDRRRLLLITQVISAGLAIGLGALVAVDAASVLVVQLFGLATGLVAVVDGPAAGAYGSSLLPPADLANGLALGSVVASAGRVAGLALAGVAVAAVGPATAFVINGFTFVAPIIVLALAAPAPPPVAPEPAHAGPRLRVGLAHVYDTPTARRTLMLSWFLSCFGRNFQVTMALMAAHAFGAGAGLYGRFSSVFAIGALVGSLVATRLGRMSGRVLIAAAATAGTFQIVSGIAPGALAFAAALLPIAACAVVIDTAVSTRVQLATHPALRGRVLAVIGLAGTTAGMVGAPLLGRLGAYGPRIPLVVGGVVVLAVTAWFGVVHAPRRASYPAMTRTAEIPAMMSTR